METYAELLGRSEQVRNEAVERGASLREAAVQHASELGARVTQASAPEEKPREAEAAKADTAEATKTEPADATKAPLAIVASTPAAKSEGFGALSEPVAMGSTLPF